jgi:hypothetical protein
MAWTCDVAIRSGRRTSKISTADPVIKYLGAIHQPTRNLVTELQAYEPLAVYWLTACNAHCTLAVLFKKKLPRNPAMMMRQDFSR